MSKPNILVFMTDQQRGDTVLDGNRALMPNIERFRAEGVTFAETYCPSPHCCPSRATFFSGLYPTEHGVWNNVNVGNTLSRGLKAGVRLWSEDLAEAGYQMRYVGKWHVSDVENPKDRGWTEGFLTSNAHRGDGETKLWERYREIAAESTPEQRPEDFAPLNADRLPVMDARNEAFIPRPGYPRYTHYGETENPFRDEEVVDDAVAFLDGLTVTGGPDEKRPWALYCGTLGPHDPYFVPARFLDLYDLDSIQLPPDFYDRMHDKPGLYRRTRARFDALSEREHRQSIRHYLAFCSYQDYLFGRVLAALERTGQRENTLVLYVSDHGDYMGEHGLWCKGLPCFRGAYHVPAVVRWPAGIHQSGRVVDDFVSLADFAPTIREAVGVNSAVGDPMTKKVVGSVPPGRSLLPFFRGERPADWRKELYTQTNGNELYGIQRAVFDRDYKYVYNGFDFDEFYDLRADPRETRNRAADPAYAELVREYCAKMWRFAYEHGDPAINPYIMVSLAPYGPAAAFQTRETAKRPYFSA